MIAYYMFIWITENTFSYPNKHVICNHKQLSIPMLTHTELNE